MKKLIYFFIPILCIISCDKNDEDSPFQVLIGNNQDMVVTNYNTYLNFGETFDLDINHDSIKDFRLIRGVASTILCLNPNSGIMGEYKTDTTYLYRETIEYRLYRADTIYDVIIENRTNYGKCRYTQNDSIVNIIPNQFKLEPKYDGNLISQTDFFITDTVDLYIPWRSKMDEDTTISYETVEILGKSYEATILETKKYDSDYCHSLPVDQICYIGVKLDVLNKQKIGWIKLSAGAGSIILISSAIQN